LKLVLQAMAISAVQMSARRVLLFCPHSIGGLQLNQTRLKNLLSPLVTSTLTRGTLASTSIFSISKARAKCDGASQGGREARLFQELAMMSAMTACSRPSQLGSLQHSVARDLPFKFSWVTAKLARPAIRALSRVRLTRSCCPSFNSSSHTAVPALRNQFLHRQRRKRAPSPPFQTPVNLQLRHPQLLRKRHPLHRRGHPSP